MRKKLSKIAAGVLAGIGGAGESVEAQPTPPVAFNKTLAGPNNRPLPSIEDLNASDALWRAVVESSAWDYTKLFKNPTLSVDLYINPKILHESPYRPRKIPDIARAYKAMTGRDLIGVDITKDREPLFTDMQQVAAQLSATFKNFGNVEPVAKNAESFRTLPKGQKRPKFLMAIPRRPSAESYKSDIDNLYHWSALKKVVEALGGEPVLVDPARPRSTISRNYENLEVFTRDPVLILDDKKIALVPDFAAIEKEGRKTKEGYKIRVDPHVPAMVAELKKLNYTIKTYKGYAQGGDFVYDPQRKLILVGVNKEDFDGDNRPFTAEDAAAMEKQTGCKVMRIPRTNEHLYHLDTGIGRLPNHKYLINPAITDEDTYKALKKLIRDKKFLLENDIIEISRDEKRYTPCFMAIGNTLIMPACDDKTEERLKKEGFKVLTPEKLGLPPGAWDILWGAVHCMVQQVKDSTYKKSIHDYSKLEDRPEYWRKEAERRLTEVRKDWSKC